MKEENVNQEIVQDFFRIVHMMRRKKREDSPVKEEHKGGQPRFRERILVILSQHEEGMSQKAIADFLHVRPQSVSEILDKLQQDALIIRKQNENDRRQYLIYVTEEGKRRGEQQQAETRYIADALMQDLSEEETDTLKKLLERVIANGEKAFNGSEGRD